MIVARPGMMLALLALALGAPTGTRAGAGEGHIQDWRIERERLNRGLEVDADTLQLVAALVGPGSFDVRSTAVSAPDGPLGSLSVLSFAPVAPDASAAPSPAFRVLVGGSRNKWLVRGGSDQALISGCFQNPSAVVAGHPDGTLMPQVVNAAVYGGRAEPLAETAAAAPPAAAWTGRFRLADGRVDEVSVVLPESWEGLVTLSRHAVEPAGVVRQLAPAEWDERWTLVKSKGWTPNRRYKPMLAMALLGQVQMKVRLATALLETTEPSAIAAGLHWLNSAAADGSKEAVDRLVAINSMPIRPSRERDGVRMDWCDCFLGKRAAAQVATDGRPIASTR